MYDPTLLAVAHSIHTDHLTQAQQALQLAETAVIPEARALSSSRRLRGWIAHRLIALAAQLTTPAHPPHVAT